MGTTLIYAQFGEIVQNLSTVNQGIDSSLKKYSPSRLMLTTAITVIALTIFSKYCHPKWGETRREQIGRLILCIPFVRKRYLADIQKQSIHFQETTKKKWEKFGPLMTTIPEEGWSTKQLVELIEKYSQLTSSGLEGKHLSGTIYSKSLDQDYKKIEPLLVDELSQELIQDDREYCDYLSKKLHSIFTLAFERSYLWNSLHSDEFGVGAYIDYQIVRMIAHLFGGTADKVMGLVTSGGTESLMLAVRCYRDWGIKNRGHQPGEGVILASQSVHAAILKAKSAYLVNVVLIETDATGKIDIEKLEKAVKKYGNKVIAIIGSALSYPLGVIDPIKEMAKIAKENGCGMHVDACLGAPIINHLPDHQTNYLEIEGVTSLSVDTHKNSLALKGSSVLVTQNLGEVNLAYYSIYSIPGWRGGVYGTPNDPGSKPVTSSLNALLALLAVGRKGHQRMAKAIHQTAVDLAEIINEFKGQLKLVGQPEVNVVAFQIDESWGLQKGATYVFAKEMAKRHIVLNTLSHDQVHFCVTIRFASDANALTQFKTAVKESLEATKNLHDELAEKGEKFSGDAGMYCALENAMNPVKKDLSWDKYVENLLFGPQGAIDAVKAYFLASFDPYKK